MRATAVEATPQALYRAFDAAGDLLYVGISLNPLARIKGHRAKTPWWADVHTITIEHVAGRDAALRAETAAIQAENPRHNVHRGMVKRTSYVHASVWGQAKAIAAKDPRPGGANISDIVRELVEDYVKRGGKR